jgi:hypothetical protein
VTHGFYWLTTWLNLWSACRPPFRDVETYLATFASRDLLPNTGNILVADCEVGSGGGGAAGGYEDIWSGVD